MIHPRAAELADVCESVYLTAADDGYTVVNLLDTTADLQIVPKDRRHTSFFVTGSDLDAMIDEAVERTNAWRQ